MRSCNPCTTVRISECAKLPQAFIHHSEAANFDKGSQKFQLSIKTFSVADFIYGKQVLKFYLVNFHR